MENVTQELKDYTIRFEIIHGRRTSTIKASSEMDAIAQVKKKWSSATNITAELVK